MILKLEIIDQIRPVDREWLERAADRQLRLTKPPASLGRLEEIANRLCAIQETSTPSVIKREIFIFAADHGVCAEGVSPYPSIVTAQMVTNFLRGGAAINALAKVAKADLTIVDIGVKTELTQSAANFIRAKVACGTKNITRGAAMTEGEMQKAVEIGIRLAKNAKDNGVKLIGLGEMGIGNTTSAAAVTSALLAIEPEQTVGRGTGADDAMLQNKVKIVKRALETNRPNGNDGFDVLQKLGGLEIAGLVGVCLGAASERAAIITDGFIATAAAALAVKICPSVSDYIFASHQSVEPGHTALLKFINQKPLLDLGMRLGEGTGAALAINLIESAVTAFNEMATFEDASVSNSKNVDLNNQFI